ncbi:MAG: hypothetical protein K0R55_2470 [Sporomusa sp.]|jgi:hypothetical protein|nr:hypothetical protein [Sporomusa sp.]
MIRRLFGRLLLCLLGSLIYISLTMPGALAETKTLAKDTKLHPQGWSVGDFIKFRKNTTVSLNQFGEVVSGTLDKDTLLSPRGWDRVLNDYYSTTVHADISPYFHRFYYRPFISTDYNVVIPSYGHLLYKGGTVVTFSDQGDVISGTIADKATVRLIAGNYGFVTFKSDTTLAFYASGAVLSGVLDEDTYLRPIGWKNRLTGDDSAGFIKFNKEKTVTFNEAGEVVSGTVKDVTTLLAEDGTRKAFPAGSRVEFDAVGAASRHDKYEQSMP